MKKILLLAVAALVGLSVLFVPDEAQAIPAFARKYRTSCTTCHIAVPKRNAFGEAFRRNGYVMPQGDELLIKQEPVELGDEEWKELFPNSVWPGLLPAEFPIAAYVHQRFVAEFGDSKRGNRVEFDMPHELEVFIGGTFGEQFSFFGEWVMFEKGKNAPGLKRFFFQLSDLLGAKNAFNIRMGRLEPAITEGYVDNNRITLEHAMTLDYKATGKWRPRDQQAGLEFRGILSHRFQYAAGVVNGEKTTISDATDEKDFYGRLAYKFGGLPLDGFQLEELTSLKQTDNWADNALTLGVYTYQGNDEAAANGLDNDFHRFGFDLHGNYNRFDLFAGAIFGTDDNPSGRLIGTEKEKELNSTAWFVEGQYLFYPWLIGGVRVGGVSSDQNGDDKDKFVTISPNITLLARANVRFTVEGLIKITGDKTVGGATVKPTGPDTEKLKWIKLNTMFVF
ncbi:MAG: hypothetical protein ACE5H0_13155 [Bacteroidota bacterium]